MLSTCLLTSSLYEVNGMITSIILGKQSLIILSFNRMNFLKNSLLCAYFSICLNCNTDLHIIVFHNIAVTEVLQACGRGSDLLCAGSSFTGGRHLNHPSR